MSQTLILIGALIFAVFIGFMIGRARGREPLGTQGRLTLDAHPATTAPQPTTTTANLKMAPLSTSSTLANVVETALDKLPDLAANLETAAQPGMHLSIKTNITKLFKLPSQQMAEAIADRERAQGMTVIVTPPDATDKNWRVTSTKTQPTKS